MAKQNQHTQKRRKTLHHEGLKTVLKSKYSLPESSAAKVGMNV